RNWLVNRSIKLCYNYTTRRKLQIFPFKSKIVSLISSKCLHL
uniref:Uncharacterized protein n=1 Tax=Ciona savignyi TaxID=51511 RepID=H2YXE1_CIOSA